MQLFKHKLTLISTAGTFWGIILNSQNSEEPIKRHPKVHVIVNNTHTHTRARRVSHVNLPVWIFLRPYDVGAKLKLDKNMNSTLSK